MSLLAAYVLGCVVVTAALEAALLCWFVRKYQARPSAEAAGELRRS